MKRFCSVVYYALFTALFVGSACLFNIFNISMWVRIGVGAGAFVLASLIGVFGNDIAPVAAFGLLISAVACGILVSTLFYEVGPSSAAEICAICAVYLGWFVLYCILSNIYPVTENYKLCMFLWAAAAVGGAVGYAVWAQSSAGWFALIMLFPFGVFFIGLTARAENAAEHLCNQGVIISMTVLSIALMLTYIIHPVGEMPWPEFGDEVDPYTFD